jgi:hypothetical protein
MGAPAECDGRSQPSALLNVTKLSTAPNATYPNINVSTPQPNSARLAAVRLRRNLDALRPEGCNPP